MTCICIATSYKIMVYHDDTKLLISCVGENDALYTAEVLLLFKTFRKFGGRVANANSELIANFVKSIDPTVKQSLEELGVKVRIVEPAKRSKETTSNKIRMLEMDNYDYDVLIALDCDTVVVRDLLTEINPEFFQAMSADMDLLTVQRWQKLFAYFGLNIPPERYNTTNKSIITYYSSAVMSIPKQYVKQLRNAWDKYFFGLFEYSQNLEELAIHRYFFEELALSLAIEKEEIPTKHFPVEMNFPTNYSVKPSLVPDDMSPIIIHYHHLYNLDGSLATSGYKMPDTYIAEVNKHFLLGSSETNKNDRTTETPSKLTQQIEIAKDINILQKVSLAKQKLVEERERWIKVRDYWLNKARQDVDILQALNLHNQKIVSQKDVDLKKAVQDVETLQNINLGHQKAREEKDRFMVELNARLEQAIKDANWLQSINFDHEKTIEEKNEQIRQLNETIKTIQRA